MKRTRAIAVFALAASFAVSAGADERLLRDFHAVVVAIEESADAPLELRVREPRGAESRVLLAPRAALEQAGFEIAAGDPVRIRAFASGEVLEAQRIRNEATGTILRLRSLRGDPLWLGGPLDAWHGAPRHGGPRRGGRR